MAEKKLSPTYENSFPLKVWNVRNSKKKICGQYVARFAHEAAEKAADEGHKPNPAWRKDFSKPNGFQVTFVSLF